MHRLFTWWALNRNQHTFLLNNLRKGLALAETDAHGTEDLSELHFGGVGIFAAIGSAEMVV